MTVSAIGAEGAEGTEVPGACAAGGAVVAGAGAIGCAAVGGVVAGADALLGNGAGGGMTKRWKRNSTKNDNEIARRTLRSIYF